MSHIAMPETQTSKLKNAFGMEIHEIKYLLGDKDVKDTIQEMAGDVFRHLGISGSKTEKILDECLDLAGSYGQVTDYEKSAHELLSREGIVKAIPEKLADRARIMHQQIRTRIKAGSVLDLGCGDGRLATLLAADGHDLQLADVYENPNIVCTGLPFQIIGQAEELPFEDNKFDNTLLLTVLHHSDNPRQVLQEAHRVTRPDGRVMVIESVFGVTGEELLPEQKAKLKKFLALSTDQQRRVNIFFDHFYNRVVHYFEDPTKKVNVPFNFNTPQDWKKIFAEVNLKQTEVMHMGLDQPVVPEYHTGHVLTVCK